MDPIPLPENPFPISALHTAYNKCLTLEAVEAPGLRPIHDCPPPIICARLLGHLLRLAPAGTNGQRQLQQEIAFAKDHAMLMRVAAVYLKHFINVFKRSSGSTTAPSEHPSRPSFEDAREYAMSVPMEECTSDHHSAWALAMHRDDNRCMLLGSKDICADLEGTAIVQAVHIIPELANTNVREHDEKHSQAARVWSILSMFTDDNVIRDLAGNHIHCLENIVSMNIVSHQLFDRLQLWLKPMEDAPHKYHVCVTRESLRLSTNPPLPKYVTFSTATTLPLPNHKYLALHALCCEVAWMSGAVQYIMDTERRMDNTKVLANDGSAVDLLMMGLSLVEAG